MSGSRPRLAVLISGTGRNLQAILDAAASGQIEADPVLVLSSRPAVQGLARAAQAGVPHGVVNHREFPDRASFDAALARQLDAHRVELIALAGFMRILTPAFVRRYSGRMLNIHPSLLPLYPGLDTHARALAAGDREHGASIHYVTPELDGGPVVLQGRIAVRADDDPASLAARLLEEVELKIYPLALAWAAAGRLQLTDQGPAFDGQPLARPLDISAIDDPGR